MKHIYIRSMVKHDKILVRYIWPEDPEAQDIIQKAAEVQARTLNGHVDMSEDDE